MTFTQINPFELRETLCRGYHKSKGEDLPPLDTCNGFKMYLQLR